MKNWIRKFMLIQFLIFLSVWIVNAQGTSISGKVSSQDGNPIPGVTVIGKGTSVGTITDFNGRFILSVPAGTRSLVFSFIGMKTKEVVIAGNKYVNVQMEEETVGIEDVVVVGYGQQKKASVIAAINQVTSKEIMKAGQSTQILSKALTGLLPGLTVIEQSSGQPGKEKTKLIIRGITSWNGSDPYILVDGVERSMDEINPSDVESISILKDASATAVYGVKGANGVVLVTTKRGVEGPPKISASTDFGLDFWAKVPLPLGSYEALSLRNTAVENLVSAYPAELSKFTPKKVLDHYRDGDMPDIFPDIDWRDYMSSRPGSSSKTNVSVTGGTSALKYYGSLTYYKANDIVSLPNIDRGLGEFPRYEYGRLNFATNLDFTLTKTTVLTANLNGYRAETVAPNSSYGFSTWTPQTLIPVYPDGVLGFPYNTTSRVNPIREYSYSGIARGTSYNINSNFILKQDLAFITKGLKLNAQFGYDNTIATSGPNASDIGNTTPTIVMKAIDGETYLRDGNMDAATVWQGLNTTSQFTVTPRNASWTNTSEQYSGGTFQKNLMYQFILDWARSFNKHDLSATGVMKREQRANAAVFPSYKEDWVARLKYGFADKYLTEMNMAYNGSEKFAPGKRFGFFPSFALGWAFSEEKWMKQHVGFLNYGKIRYSNGYVGSDNGINPFLYRTQWAKTASTYAYGFPTTSVNPYQIMYNITQIGNPDARWETNHKQNIGLETRMLDGLISFNADYYWERREGIFMGSTLRTSIPDWFGAPAVAANLGETVGSGMELELKINKTFRNLRVFANANWTVNNSEVIYKEEPDLRPAYQKEQGYRMGQLTKPLSNGFYNSWDDVYSSAVNPTDQKLIPGTFKVIDYDANGILQIAQDAAPTGYTISPKNTANLTTGASWKGLDFSVQFYSAYNVSGWNEDIREFNDGTIATIYAANRDEAWTPERAADGTARRNLLTTVVPATYGDYIILDGSYIRLQNMQVGYTFSPKALKKLGVSALKATLVGYNLYTWTGLPFEKAITFGQRGVGAGTEWSGASGAVSNYPPLRRVSLGLNVTF